MDPPIVTPSHVEHEQGDPQPPSAHLIASASEGDSNGNEPTPTNAADLLPEADGATRDPYAVKRWLSWAEAVRRSELSASAEFSVFERAVAALPGSYKLWRLYATRAHSVSFAYHPAHPAREHAVSVALRAARALRAAPRLWEDALALCASEGRLVAGLSALDDALRALPVTQHDRLWRTALEWMVPPLPAKTSMFVLSRYAKLRPLRAALPLFDARVRAKAWDAAVSGLLRTLSAHPDWKPVGDRTREELWVAAMQLAVKHPSAVVSVDAPAMLRNALREGPDAAHGLQTADLYKLLARYHVRLGHFDDARAVYEEAVTTVRSVRDFAVLYDAYAKFEEGLVTSAMEDLEEIRAEGDEADAEERREVEEGLERLMADLEKLADRRPMLLSDVWLRQNPNNVHEWHKRARLLKKSGDAAAVVAAYMQAVNTVDPHLSSNGRPHTLWLAFASYYEAAEDGASARKVLDKAVSEPSKFAQPQDLAAVWCEYAEMELRFEKPMRALELLRTATTQPKEDRQQAMKRSGGAVRGANGVIYYDHNEKGRVWSYWRSNRLWSFLIDLTESLEPPDKVSATYHQLIDTGSATAQNILNGADWLCSRRYFEQAFRLYERGAATLPWPHAMRIWAAYLSRFLRRHGRDKRERVRSLFEAALAAAPPTRRFGVDIPNEHLAPLFTRYASAEERPLGAPRRALAILARACRDVRTEDRADMFRIRVARAGALLGAPRARPVYEDALQSLPNRDDALAFALRFAALETSLGELDRARAVFRHAARVADPRAPIDANTVSARFWKAWQDLELAHGAEDSFRDMLRARRAVMLRSVSTHLPTSAAAGAGTVEMAASQEVGAEEVGAEAPEADAPASIAELERRALAATRENGEDTSTAVGLGEESEGKLDAAPTAGVAAESGESEAAPVNGEREDDGGSNVIGESGEGNETGESKRKRADEDRQATEESGGKKGMGALERFKRQRK